MVKAQVYALLDRLTKVGPYIVKRRVTTINRQGDKQVVEQPMFFAVDQNIINRGGEWDFEKSRSLVETDHYDAARKLYGIVKMELLEKQKGVDKRKWSVLDKWEERDMLKQENLYGLIDYCFRKLRLLDIIAGHDRFWNATVLKGVGDDAVPIGQKMLSEKQVDEIYGDEGFEEEEVS